MTVSSHYECVQLLQEAQEAEEDNREMSHEADLFLNKRDGQWEPQIISTLQNRPRYTFDECNPIIDGIMGEIESMDFGITVNPTGRQASKEIAQVFSGMIRTIQNLSKPSANFIYNQAARVMVGTGFDAWRVVSKFRDSDSFQQDLMIQHVPNAQDCVWFDPNYQLPDASDSDFAWNLTSITKRAYKEKYKKGSGRSLPQHMTQQAWTAKKPDEVIIGEFLYKKKKYRELALMTNGNVYEVNDDFNMVIDELKAAGVNIHKTRKRPYDVVYQRLMDGDDWLAEEKETVFCYIPIVPVFGNFRISENKVIYWGIVEKLMDPQRVINYSESRKIEEGALSAKGKIWMTKDQSKSVDVRKTLSTLNTNNDPVQFYDSVEGQVPPMYIGSPPSNPGLMETTSTAQNFIQRTSGTYDEDRGTAPPRRSGIAIEKLQMKSDAPKRKWFTSMEIAIAHTAEILIKAIPKVYDTQQVVTITGEDGTVDTTVIHQKVTDAQTGKVVTLNDLSVGKYTVFCKAGPAFSTRQSETVAAITDLSQIDPTIMQLGADIFLNNINAPGIDKIAARKRRQMVIEGLIIPEQLTDEEKKLMKQLSENKDSDMSPIDKANLMIAQAQMQETQGKNEERAGKLELEQMKVQLAAQRDKDKKIMDSLKMLNDQIKTQAETLKIIREASGVEQIASPSLVRVFEQQTDELSESVNNQ